MKKKLLSSIIITVMVMVVYGQNIPNAGFENWETIKIFDEPVLWNSGNIETYSQGLNCVTKTTDSYSGAYALKLTSDTLNSEISFGYVFSNGRLVEQELSDTPRYSGGFPITLAPDSLCGFFKYNIAANDTAIGLLSFKKNGVIVGQDLIRITGSSNKFVRLAFDIDETLLTPDTAMVAFSCTNPFDEPVAGNWLIIDSIWFIGSSDTIPNADFEDWTEVKYDDPVGWASLNELLSVNKQQSVTKTTDKYNGSFAVRIESMTTINPAGNPDTISTGILIPQPNGGSLSNSNDRFNINFNPNELTGYYKFEPADKDTAGVAVNIIDINSQIYYTGTFLLPTSTYTKFSIPLTYPVKTIVKQVYIAFTTNYKNQGLKGETGSVLYIDDLELTDRCEGKDALVIVDTTEDECLPQVLDAGDGWDSYLWSTDDTTQTITITNALKYSVEVTDELTGCYMVDTLYIGQTICDEIKETISHKPSIEIYPVPATTVVNVNLANIVPGVYNIEVIAITGSVIKKQVVSVTNNDQTIEMPVADLAPGLYLCTIKGKGLSETLKLKIK